MRSRAHGAPATAGSTRAVMHRPGSRSRPQPRTSRQSKTVAGELKEEKRSAGLGRTEPLRIAGTVVLVALWAANLAVDHSTVQTVLGFVLIAVLVQVTISDLEERRIKNRVTFPAAIAAVVIGAILHPSGVPGAAGGGCGDRSFPDAVRGSSRAVVWGWGDAKLGVVLGLYLSHEVLRGDGGRARSPARSSASVYSRRVGSAQAARRQSRWARSWRLEEWSRCSQDQVCIWPRNLKNLCL